MEVLLLPGLDGTGRLFNAFAQSLAPALRPRVASYPPDRALGYDELLDSIDLPDALFAIVGESFSGPLAIRLAARHPDRVRALVLVATFARGPLLARAGSWLAWLTPRTVPRWLIRRLLLGPEASDEEVDGVRAVMSSVQPAVVAARLHEIATVDASAEFAATRMPALYLRAARDALVGDRAAARMKALRPDLRIEAIDAPHLVLQRRPAEAASVIARFLLEGG